MADQFEAFVMADPIFYDVLHAASAAVKTFDTADRPLPDGWTRSDQDDWFVFATGDASLPDQGWKIHVSACLDNAGRILDAVWDYCVPRRIEFKFLRSRASLLARVSKYAPRGYSGKLVTIYPRDEAACETILRELGEILDGEPNPYILSDLRWGKGPLYVRYGGFRLRYMVDDQGEPVAAIADPDGALVPDVRGPVFAAPSWVTVPDFLAPHLEARNAIKVDSMPYTIERVLHFSNGGGIYVGRDTRTGEQVVLKEGRPHSGLDAWHHDAVRRLEREYEIMQRLAGIPGIPRVHDLFWLGEHRFLAMEYIEGMVLSRAIVRRYPIIRPNAGPAEYAQFTDWALKIFRQVEDTLTAMHERGVVYGDMHLFNIMVREGGSGETGEGGPEEAVGDEIALLDFEVAAPIEQATQPGLGNQGFAAPRDTTGVDIDRYGLACLRLALFLPMTSVLWLHRPKVHHFAKIITDHFPVDPEFVAPAVATIAPDPTPEPVVQIEPDPEQWPAVRDELARAIVASATPDRDDRLFPGDVAQFALGGLGLAYGAAGVLYALSATGAGRYPEFEQWLVRHAASPPSGTRPGLYDGLHGVAYALDHLGHRQAALDTVDMSLSEDWKSLGSDLFGGLAGIGLNLLHLADRTGEPALRATAHHAAELVAERIGNEPVPEATGQNGDEPAVSGREQGYAGLLRGRSGAALLLLRAYDDTGDAGYLDRAAVALRHDLLCCVWRDGILEVNEGWRTMPYVDGGSVGIGLVLDQYLARRPDEQFAEASRGAEAAAQSEMYILPGLFSGRAGILLYLAGRCAARAADPAVARQVRGLAWHALPFGERDRVRGEARVRGQARERRLRGPGLAFPGTGLLRLSMDLATGTAGVLLALGAALHDMPVHAPLLASDPSRGRATPAGPTADRADPRADRRGIVIPTTT